MTTAGYVINVLVFVLCALMALQQIGVSVAPLLATAGVASVAIGFGAQSLVRDLFAGFFILFEDQFAVGDVISIEGRTGTVEYMTLRLTKVRLGDGSLLMIPNGEIKKIENATSGFSQIDFKISVVVGTQIEMALSLLAGELSRLVADFKDDVVSSPELLGVDTIKNSTIILRARVRTRPGKHFPLERELNQRVVARFMQANIQLPPNA
jgi:small conductance mechanosensitive channel